MIRTPITANHSTPTACSHVRENTDHVYKAIGSIVVLLCCSLPFIRHRFYEVFSTVHLLLAVTTVTALAVHIIPGSPLRTAGSFYGLVATWAITVISRICLILYRSRGCHVSVETLGNGSALRLTLKLPKSITIAFKAGQYVSLRIPWLGISSIFQSHPFTVVWWDEDRAYLLVEPQNGLSRKLWLFNGKVLKAFIEGPYGSKKEETFGSHGTVLMVASGIGIAGVLPFVKYLCEGHHRREVCTRKICLLWLIERDGKYPCPFQITH